MNPSPMPQISTKATSITCASCSLSGGIHSGAFRYGGQLSGVGKIIRHKFYHANLLVVFLLVPAYKTVRARQSKVFQEFRPAREATSQTAWLQSGRHDLFRLLRPPLAADRGRQAHHCYHAIANLRGFPHFHWPRSRGVGQGYLSKAAATDRVMRLCLY